MSLEDITRHHPFEVGELVEGVYLLRSILGCGGMAQVFEADDVRLGRRVAIKVDRDPRLGPRALGLEARALAAIHHPGLPIIHGLGVHRGWTYLVLERLYGIDLERHLVGPDGTARRLDPPEALPILASIADVLAAVHRGGMAHRDLKPGNVMLCADRVVLLDFGVVVPEVDAAHVARAGTPHYAAPEVICRRVARGRAHLVDSYSFGALAFELFAGQPPFDSHRMVDLLEQHLSSAPPDLAEIRPDLPREIPALVAACLAKEPLDRPGDMEMLAGDLRTLLRRSVRGARTTLPIGELRETYRTPEVLIVEDDVDIRDTLADILTARGFRARVAANGREAQDLIARSGRRPSVIVLDLMMPVMDGEAFLETQSTHPGLDGVPVVLVTAQSPERALRFAAVRGVFQKPLELGALLRCLGDVCSVNAPARGASFEHA